MAVRWLVAACGLLLGAPGWGAEPANDTFAIPSSLQEEHHHLRQVLERARREEGELGTAANRLAERLTPHFEKEERWALPQLALLVPLSQGEVTAEMRSAIDMAERLQAEYPNMLKEHETIREAVEAFRQAAERVGKMEYVAFADALARHARQEEAILYPAAILIGRYLDIQLPAGHGSYAQCQNTP